MTSAAKIKKVSKFHDLLNEQIRNEFNASQQYIAVAAWFDDDDLPQLAGHFYKQAVEERNHAMMLVQYLLDKNMRPTIPGVDSVRNDFKDAEEIISLALEQENDVTAEINALIKAARDEDDYQGEQFMHWFLKEQVEEVASMDTLLHTVRRAEGNMFHVEDYLAREAVGGGADPTAPRAAGGAL